MAEKTDICHYCKQMYWDMYYSRQCGQAIIYFCGLTKKQISCFDKCKSYEYDESPFETHKKEV